MLNSGRIPFLHPKDLPPPRFTVGQLLSRTPPAKDAILLAPKRKQDLQKASYLCLDVVAPVYNHRRHEQVKSQHRQCLTVKLTTPQNSRQPFLKKGMTNSHHALQANLNRSKRLFFEQNELAGHKKQEAEVLKRQFLRRNKKCEPLCGIFKIKCCNCSQCLDSFNKQFIEILRKRNLFHTQPNNQSEDHLKQSIINQIRQTFQSFSSSYFETNCTLFGQNERQNFTASNQNNDAFSLTAKQSRIKKPPIRESSSSITKLSKGINDVQSQLKKSIAELIHNHYKSGDKSGEKRLMDWSSTVLNMFKKQVRISMFQNLSHKYFGSQRKERATLGCDLIERNSIKRKSTERPSVKNELLLKNQMLPKHGQGAGLGGSELLKKKRRLRKINFSQNIEMRQNTASNQSLSEKRIKPSQFSRSKKTLLKSKGKLVQLLDAAGHDQQPKSSKSWRPSFWELPDLEQAVGSINQPLQTSLRESEAFVSQRSTTCLKKGKQRGRTVLKIDNQWNGDENNKKSMKRAQQDEDNRDDAQLHKMKVRKERLKKARRRNGILKVRIPEDEELNQFQKEIYLKKKTQRKVEKFLMKNELPKNIIYPETDSPLTRNRKISFYEEMSEGKNKISSSVKKDLSIYSQIFHNLKQSSVQYNESPFVPEADNSMTIGEFLNKNKQSLMNPTNKFYNLVKCELDRKDVMTEVNILYTRVSDIKEFEIETTIGKKEVKRVSSTKKKVPLQDQDKGTGLLQKEI